MVKEAREVKGLKAVREVKAARVKGKAIKARARREKAKRREKVRSTSGRAKRRERVKSTSTIITIRSLHHRHHSGESQLQLLLHNKVPLLFTLRRNHQHQHLGTRNQSLPFEEFIRILKR